MDRIDIHLDVWRSAPGQVLRSGEGVSSESLREGVTKAREFATYRSRKYAHDASSRPNSRDVLASCMLAPEEENFLERAATIHHMSGRGIFRTLSIARTIADIAESARVNRSHLSEALQLRLKERGGAHG